MKTESQIWWSTKLTLLIDGNNIVGDEKPLYRDKYLPLEGKKWHFDKKIGLWHLNILDSFS